MELWHTCIHAVDKWGIIESFMRIFPLLFLNMGVLRYLGLTRSISWLLIPWLLKLPGHQQPWYWLCRICRSWSYFRKDLSICAIPMWSNDIKCKYMFMFPLKNLARKELIYTCALTHRCDFYPRPVLAFGRVLSSPASVGLCVCVSITSLSAW